MVSPADLEKVEFSVAFRGYNGDQVDDYIDMVVKEFTELTNEYEKYKVLCEKQNDQIKIMRERIHQLENAAVLSAVPTAAVAAEPETVVKTVVKTVVDTKASEEALSKAGALEKLTAEFKAKALELYKAHLSELESLNFDYDPADFTVETQISETDEEVAIAEIKEEIAEENGTVEASEEVAEETVEEEITAIEAEEEVSEENDTSEPIEELTEETDSPIVTEETAEEENVEESVTNEVTSADEDDILSADEIDALCEGASDDLNNIIDELSGLFTQDDVKIEDVSYKKTQPEKVAVTPKLVQQSFDSLFITTLDDSE